MKIKNLVICCVLLLCCIGIMFLDIGPKIGRAGNGVAAKITTLDEFVEMLNCVADGNVDQVLLDANGETKNLKKYSSVTVAHYSNDADGEVNLNQEAQAVYYINGEQWYVEMGGKLKPNVDIGLEVDISAESYSKGTTNLLKYNKLEMKQNGIKVVNLVHTLKKWYRIDNSNIENEELNNIVMQYVDRINTTKEAFAKYARIWGGIIQNCREDVNQEFEDKYVIDTKKDNSLMSLLLKEYYYEEYYEKIMSAYVVESSLMTVDLSMENEPLITWQFILSGKENNSKKIEVFDSMRFKNINNTEVFFPDGIKIYDTNTFSENIVKDMH